MMNSSKKTKSLVSIIVFLLITNIAMLVFFIVINKPAERRQRMHSENAMYNSLKTDVGFSQEQLDQYKNLREEQMGRMHPLFNQVREAKKEFYALVNADSASDATVHADADSIAEKQKNLDMQMFLYLKNVRRLCTTEQTPKFDSLVKKVVARMIGHSGQPHKK